VILKSLNL